MVLFLFFGFAMTSTMTTSFLYHVVRDRECIQSKFFWTLFWIRFQPRSVRSCSRSLLDSKREGHWEHCTLGIVPHNSNISTLSSLSIFCWMGCRRYSAASRLEVKKWKKVSKAREKETKRKTMKRRKEGKQWKEGKEGKERGKERGKWKNRKKGRKKGNIGRKEWKHREKRGENREKRGNNRRAKGWKKEEGKKGWRRKVKNREKSGKNEKRKRGKSENSEKRWTWWKGLKKGVERDERGGEREKK